MSRRTLPWLGALPIVLVGSQVAHGIAYWWAYPEADVRASVLHSSGHSYLAYAPMLLGLAAGAELLALGATALDAARRVPARTLPLWLFAALPLVAFTLQEHLERLIATGTFPWWTALDPTFWRGLVLQIPIGLVAWLVARLLQRSAVAVGRSLSAAPPRHAPEAAAHGRPSGNRDKPRIAPLATAAAGRAPPISAVG